MNQKKWGVWQGVVLVLSCFIGAAHAQVMQERDVVMGVQQHIDLPKGVQRIAIADDTIVHVVVERVKGAGHPAKLMLTPLKVGSTSLMVWTGGGPDPQSWLLNVKPSVQVRRNKYESLTDMVLQEAAQKTAEGSGVINAGTVVHKSNVVQVDVKIVEVNKNRLQQAGLNLFSTAANSHGFSFGLLSPGAASSPSFDGGALQGITSSPFSQAFGLLMNFGKANIGLNLGMLEGSGMARVLAEPSLLAISGQSANFLAGGEVPIPVAQGNGAINIEYKSYGVGLTVSPTILDNQRIVLKVAPESSELDYANAVTLQSVAVPALTVRKADTTVELGDGESFVIGGLVSQNTTSNVNRVPVLSEIPILGTLFKRQEFSRKERELVIVVTPRLVRPIAANASLAEHLPGASQAQAPGRGFWSSYVGPTGGSDQLPGFSQ
jgi:pilus assembly protein CpaC